MRMLAVFERDIRRILRNPFALLAAVLLPLLYLLILGNSLQGQLKHLRLGIVVEDEGAPARALVGALQALEQGPRTVRVHVMPDEVTGVEAVRAGRLSGLLVIPPTYSREVNRRLTATVGLIVDNADAISAGALNGAVSGALAGANAPPIRLELENGPPELRVQELFPRVDYDASLVPGVVVMSLFMGSLIAGGFNLVMDRFLGIHESYLSTPLRKQDIALGTLMSGSLVTCTAATIVLTVGLIGTGARIHGGALGVAAVLLVLLLTGLGLLAMMMALLGRATHPRTTGVLSGFLSVILFFPSGALYPIQSFPGWLRAFAHVDPETHAVAALKAILFRGGDLAAAGGHVAYLGVFTAAMLVLAIVTLKRTL